ncbi:hypothetical protein K469DRAFT_695275 [Zopfia rhizophila CBS 207.26]|uniref:Uncharacterized protein n=1 Tax=Zopfia rhizophila CBS 207.26 TaxID=1314779 RepID=A0A6A6DGW0_9PEZI|nr:hypothetical protein K469DRAFT_695275 [Zopfia rhizophila CBS 207.26]
MARTVRPYTSPLPLRSTISYPYLARPYIRSAGQTPALRRPSNHSTSLQTEPNPILDKCYRNLKPANILNIRYSATELAKFMLKLYLEMFQGDSPTRTFQMLGNNWHLYDLYTRASFVALLQAIKKTKVVEWHPFIDALVDNILDDQTLTMGPHYLPSLFIHLDMSHLYSMDKYLWWHPKDMEGPFHNWKNIPAIICKTIVVPHSAIALFNRITSGNGTPLCHLRIRSSVTTKEAIYPDIQLGFGVIETSGTPYTNDYALFIKDDGKRYMGQSSLVVSAMVATCSITEYRDIACNVFFDLKNTPANLVKFTSKLGLLLNLHKSAVGQRDVFFRGTGLI